MEHSRPPTYAAKNSQEDYGTSGTQGDDVESSSSGTYSVAASPYWKGPIEKAAKSSPKSSTGFSPAVAFCFTINYILGAGFLTIPWAFVQSGLVLSSVMLLVSALGSDIAKDFMLETMSRAEAMLDEEMHWIKIDKKTGGIFSGKSGNNKNHGERILLRPPAKIERERLLQTKNQKDNNSYQIDLAANEVENKQGDGEKSEVKKSISFQSLRDAFTKANITTTDVQEKDSRLVVIKPQKYIVKDRKFEMNALCRVFLGKDGLRVFTLTLCLYICGTLWVYTSVFSSAMARAFPIFFEDHNGDLYNVFHLSLVSAASAKSLNYFFYAMLFGCIVVPLSCLELDEQVSLQVFLTGCRFVMFFFMIGTSHMCADDMSAISAIKMGTRDKIQEMHENTVENFQWSGVAKTLPILIFANIFHHSIPGLTHPAADKTKIGRVFMATNLFTTTAYLVLGVTLASAFGKSIEQSSNLNWSYFHANTGHLDDEGNVIGAAWWTKAVSIYVMVFPGIDVISAFPLNAITLGNNLFGAVYGKRISEVESNRWLRTSFRLLASIPPIIFGILVRELGVITDYTGTAGFMFGLSFPALLYIASRRIAQRRRFALDTFYSSYGSTTAIACVMFCVGIIMILFVLVTLTWFD